MTPTRAEMEALRDELRVGISNLRDLPLHTSVRLRDHAMPCRNLDFCVVSDAVKRMSKTADLIDALLKQEPVAWRWRERGGSMWRFIKTNPAEWYAHLYETEPLYVVHKPTEGSK
jgi:hypothetical protein